MVRRLARVLSLVRDAAVMLASLVIIGSQYPQLGEDPVFVVTVSISALLVILCAFDVALVAVNRGRGAMLGIAAFQLVPGILWMGLFLPLGLIVVPLNVVVLVALRQKKTPEELLKHPPAPRTRNYKVAVGMGALVMLSSIFLPWFSASGVTASLFSVYSAIVTHSGNLPGVSIEPVAVAFALAALFGSPLAVVFSALAIRWRKLALVSGILAVGAGAGAALTVAGGTGLGAYLLAAGGIVALVAFLGFRRTA